MNNDPRVITCVLEFPVSISTDIATLRITCDRNTSKVMSIDRYNYHEGSWTTLPEPDKVWGMHLEMVVEYENKELLQIIDGVICNGLFVPLSNKKEYVRVMNNYKHISQLNSIDDIRSMLNYFLNHE